MQSATRGLWDQHKFFLGQGLAQLTEENRDNRLTPDSSSIAFWFQHIAESKLLLLEGLFGVHHGLPLSTVMGATDTGQAGSVESILELNAKADRLVDAQIDACSDAVMAETRDTFLGPMTVNQMFGVIIYHTYYHLGQAQLATKRGKTYPVELQMAA